MSAPPSPPITPIQSSPSPGPSAPPRPDPTAPPGPPWAPPAGPHSWGDGPPPWWPEDEPFPPMWWPEHGARPPKRRGPRGGFLRRVGCFFGAVVGLMVAASLLGALFAPGRHGPPFGAFGFVIIVLILVWAGRALHGTAEPIGEVMEAADRVAGGDYGVRVETRAKGEVGRLVQSFNAMTLRLQANEVQRRNLLADIAHELRTPLTVVRGTVEGMLDGVYPRDDERLGVVLEETAVMARLLDDLRTLSLADAGALPLHREMTDVVELVDDVVAGHQPRAEAAGIDLRAVTEPVPPADIDPVRIRQVLDNLLANAISHTPRGGAARVGARPCGDRVVLAVRDTGSGIPPDDLARVFDRFWKAADSGGTGLGLAIARGLVEAHGGTIKAESQPGRGTTMTVTLPLRPPAARRSAAAS
jgi:signal transduction histidine kinase